MTIKELQVRGIYIHGWEFAPGKVVNYANLRYVHYLDEFKPRRMVLSKFEREYLPLFKPNYPFKFEVDWTDLESVNEFYEHFTGPLFWVKNGHSEIKCSKLVQIKDNIAYDGEFYYIPMAASSLREEVRPKVEDGEYWVDTYPKAENPIYGEGERKHVYAYSTYGMQKPLPDISLVRSAGFNTPYDFRISAHSVHYSASFMEGFRFYGVNVNLDLIKKLFHQYSKATDLFKYKVDWDNLYFNLDKEELFNQINTLLNSMDEADYELVLDSSPYESTSFIGLDIKPAKQYEIFKVISNLI